MKRKGIPWHLRGDDDLTLCGQGLTPPRYTPCRLCVYCLRAWVHQHPRWARNYSLGMRLLLPREDPRQLELPKVHHVR